MDPLIDGREGPRVAASVPVALRFPDGDASEGWGRLLDIALGGARLESRWPHRVGQAVYLTFEPRPGMRLENLRSRVTRVRWEEGYYIAAVSFDETVDKTYLREALSVILNNG